MSASDAGMDTVVMHRPASWRRPRSTVICCLYVACDYAAMGYNICWEATLSNLDAERARALASSAEQTPDDASGMNP